MHRSFVQIKREPHLIKAKIVQGVVTAIFMLFVFSGLDIYDATESKYIEQNLTSLSGAIFFCSVVQMFTNF